MTARFIVLAASASLAMTAAPAFALVINYNGSNVNMGDLHRGQTGTISDILHGDDEHFKSTVKGMLPRMSQVIFTYNFTGFEAGELTDKISYNYRKSGVHYWGTSTAHASADDDGEFHASVDYDTWRNGRAAVSQVFAFAKLTDSEGHGDHDNRRSEGNDAASGKVILTNYTQSFQAFTDVFHGLFECDHSGRITYTVSAIPLPATLPMTGLGLLGMTAFARLRQRRTVAA